MDEHSQTHKNSSQKNKPDKSSSVPGERLSQREQRTRDTMRAQEEAAIREALLKQAKHPESTAPYLDYSPSKQAKTEQGLDKTTEDAVETTPDMGGERQSISHPEAPTVLKTREQQREELAAKFTYKDVSQIPPGVDPKQLDFLRDAAIAGVFERVAPDTAHMLEEYFTTESTQEDIAKEFRITPQAVHKRIMRGLDKLHRVNPELPHKYPLEQIKKGKDETVVFKSKRSKERRSDASLRSREKRSDAHINRRKKQLQDTIPSPKPLD